METQRLPHRLRRRKTRRPPRHRRPPPPRGVFTPCPLLPPENHLEPRHQNRHSKPSSPSNLPGKRSAPGSQPTMTNPEPTRPNFGIKPPPQAGNPRKSISETAAHSSWNTPDARAHRLEANLRYNTKIPLPKKLLARRSGKVCSGSLKIHHESRPHFTSTVETASPEPRDHAHPSFGPPNSPIYRPSLPPYPLSPRSGPRQ